MLSSYEVFYGLACNIIKLCNVISVPLTGLDLVKLLCIKVEFMRKAVNSSSGTVVRTSSIGWEGGC